MRFELERDPVTTSLVRDVLDRRCNVLLLLTDGQRSVEDPFKLAEGVGGSVATSNEAMSLESSIHTVELLDGVGHSLVVLFRDAFLIATATMIGSGLGVSSAHSRQTGKDKVSGG